MSSLDQEKIDYKNMSFGEQVDGFLKRAELSYALQSSQEQQLDNEGVKGLLDAILASEQTRKRMGDKINALTVETVDIDHSELKVGLKAHGVKLGPFRLPVPVEVNLSLKNNESDPVQIDVKSDSDNPAVNKLVDDILKGKSEDKATGKPGQPVNVAEEVQNIARSKVSEDADSMLIIKDNHVSFLVVNPKISPTSSSQIEPPSVAEQQLQKSESRVTANANLSPEQLEFAKEIASQVEGWAMWGYHPAFFVGADRQRGAKAFEPSGKNPEIFTKDNAKIVNAFGRVSVNVGMMMARGSMLVRQDFEGFINTAYVHTLDQAQGKKLLMIGFLHDMTHDPDYRGTDSFTGSTLHFVLPSQSAEYMEQEIIRKPELAQEFILQTLPGIDRVEDNTGIKFHKIRDAISLTSEGLETVVKESISLQEPDQLGQFLKEEQQKTLVKKAEWIRKLMLASAKKSAEETGIDLSKFVQESSIYRDPLGKGEKSAESRPTVFDQGKIEERMEPDLTDEECEKIRDMFEHPEKRDPAVLAKAYNKSKHDGLKSLGRALNFGEYKRLVVYEGIFKIFQERSGFGPDSIMGKMKDNFGEPPLEVILRAAAKERPEKPNLWEIKRVELTQLLIRRWKGEEYKEELEKEIVNWFNKTEQDLKNN